MLVWKCQHVEHPQFEKWSERRGPKHPDDPSNKFLRVLNMGSISARKHEMLFVIWDEYYSKRKWYEIRESWKLWNQETERTRNQEALKPRFQETKIPRNQETLHPSTYRLPPLHQTTLLGYTSELGGYEPSWGTEERIPLVVLCTTPVSFSLCCRATSFSFKLAWC